MTVSPHLRLSNDALSHQAKRDVLPVAKPERPPVKEDRGRPGALKRGRGPKRRSPLGHASPEQKAKVEREGPRLIVKEAIYAGWSEKVAHLDPAHVVPRAIGGCDHEDCVVPLTRRQHEAYDRGELDLLPYLTLDEQAHAVRHLGILGALKRATGDIYVVERETP